MPARTRATRFRAGVMPTPEPDALDKMRNLSCCSFCGMALQLAGGGCFSPSGELVICVVCVEGMHFRLQSMREYIRDNYGAPTVQ